jgi:hypothetical protein
MDGGVAQCNIDPQQRQREERTGGEERGGEVRAEEEKKEEKDWRYGSSGRVPA